MSRDRLGRELGATFGTPLEFPHTRSRCAVLSLLLVEEENRAEGYRLVENHPDSTATQEAQRLVVERSLATAPKNESRATQLLADFARNVTYRSFTVACGGSVRTFGLRARTVRND